MKKIITLLIILLSIDGFSQLYFSPNSFAYAKDQVVFVTQDVNMQSNSNFYLRNEAQLLQGTSSVSTNKGLGKVSVFQEGTSDNFDYNYWCSPVGNASNTPGNENFGITMLNRPTSAIASTPAIMLDWGNYDGTANPLSISSRWIYKYLSGTAYAQWIYVGTTNGLAAGEGFSMKGTSGTDPLIVEGNTVQNNPGNGNQRYDFRGKPNDGNITVNLLINNNTFTGNPYPSALNMNKFLLDPGNTAGGGAAYYWEQKKDINSHYVADYVGGYGTFSPISIGSNGVYAPARFDTYNTDGSLNNIGTTFGNIYPRKFAPIGQGFFLLATATGTATIKNSHREYYKESGPLTQFERHTNQNKNQQIADNGDVSHFRINAVLNNQYSRQIALAFVPEATDGVDFGIDAIDINDELPNDFYFFLDNNRYAIQGINFSIEKRIPLGVKSQSNSTIKFYVPEIVNFDTTQGIYIYDALDQTYHDIKNDSYQVSLEAGVFNNRFEITFVNETLGISEDIKTNFTIIQNNLDQLLTIKNPYQVDIKSITVYDIIGKRIFSHKDLGTDLSYEFPTNGLSPGIYIVEMATNDAKKISQKIIISGTKN